MTSLVPRPPPHSVETIAQFLRAHALSDGSDGVIVGLSGGIDSALVARLARDALGPDKVLGLLMPDAVFPGSLRAETEEYARALGIEYRTVPIETVENAFRALMPELSDRVSLGNVKARIRMTLAYAVARERHRLVAALKGLALPIAGTLGFERAEVTTGGVALDEVDPMTLESRRVPGLHFAGEVLDLDGPIGGYNFQAAFSTGWLAGESV